jgi:hypothetical protein
MRFIMTATVLFHLLASLFVCLFVCVFACLFIDVFVCFFYLPAAFRDLCQLAVTHRLHRGPQARRIRIRRAIDRHAPGLLGRVLVDVLQGTTML